MLGRYRKGNERLSKERFCRDYAIIKDAMKYNDRNFAQIYFEVSYVLGEMSKAT